MGQSSVRVLFKMRIALDDWLANPIFGFIGSSALTERAYRAVESTAGKVRRRAILARRRGERGGAEGAEVGGADDGPFHPFITYFSLFGGRSYRFVRIRISNLLSRCCFHQARIGKQHMMI